jgi:hypothetical protein
VRFILNRSNIDIQFMDENQHIKSTTTGMGIAYRCMHPEGDEKTKPFTLDLIMVAWQKYWDVKRKCEDYVMLIAMMLTYVCSMRKSEYLEEYSDHYLLAESVSLLRSRVPVGVRKDDTSGVDRVPLTRPCVGRCARLPSKFGPGRMVKEVKDTGSRVYEWISSQHRTGHMTPLNSSGTSLACHDQRGAWRS